jgi:hypothetical protein
MNRALAQLKPLRRQLQTPKLQNELTSSSSPQTKLRSLAEKRINCIIVDTIIETLVQFLTYKYLCIKASFAYLKAQIME